MKIKTVKHIFFDLDHTLWDFDKNSELTFKYIFEKRAINLDFKAFIKGYEVINLKYWKLYRTNQISKENLRFDRLQEALNNVNYKAEDKLIIDLANDYITYLSTFNHLFEGTLELLEYLKPDYKLHIITNGFTEGQTKKMKNSGLQPYFSTITDAETVGVKKPNPTIFNYALNTAGATLNNSIMVGDSYEADILGAIDMGLDAIFFNPIKQENINNVKEVTTLLQLKKYF